ncbi:TPA: hypothetical protein NG570_004582 [Vibrio parahaemolyticus]|nr:hypothetical protein [Vibrio parahaemolyticus]EJA3100636.1 hypothetical protein [Vibrio parahaemolyticus]HAV1374367.1 hypothetical protein [Vibrio parahaemolyticus]HCE2196609.1 hypothetical protein [Vibrio parahaemolyticus]HCE3299160.1 hypothetical protein [Vibrio parahaemolyticus]
MFDKACEYDINSKGRIYNLLVLKGESLIKADFLARCQGIKEGENYANFYSAMSDQIDLLLSYYINDEITASLDARGGLLDLIEETINDYYEEEHFKRLEFAKEDLQRLFKCKTDFLVSSSLVDFKVSTYSVFEYYVDKLYEQLISIYPRSNKKEEDLISLIRKCPPDASDEKMYELVDKIKRISFYVSGLEKINYVISKSKLSKEEKKEAREFISFYGSLRNTIHNLGVNRGKSKSITIKGIDITLDEGACSYTDNHNSTFFACQKLMEIYEKIHQDITGEVCF